MVVLGKGDRDFQTVGRKQLAWSDREFVRNLLYARESDSAAKPQLVDHLDRRFRVVG